MQNRSMYITPIPWPSKYVVAEKSAMGSSAYLRPLESQLQQENSSFSVGMKHQWQPKKAAFSVDQQHQTWGKELENEASRRDKGTSSGLDEECKEFVRMFREKLQEFAMILSKKYHYNFPVEYFDDYHGSFNKEEFLKIEKPKEEKSEEKELEEGNQSIDNLSSTLTSAKTLGQVSIIEQSLDGSEVAASPDVNAHKQPWYEYSRKEYKPPLLHFEAAVSISTAKHGCRMNGSTSIIPKSTGASFATSFPTQSGIALPVFHHAGTIQGVQQPAGSFSSGCLPSNNLPIALSQISNGSSHDHSRGQDTFAEERDTDFFFSQGNFSVSYDHESSPLDQQQIQRGEEFWRPVVAGKKLREVAEEVVGFAEGNKIPAVVLVLPPVGKFKCWSIALTDEQMVEVDAAASYDVVTVEEKEKRKKSRRIKKERSIKLIEKAGIG